MGVGDLHIGQGLGGAQVFGHNPAIQQFGEMLAQRKAKQDSDNKFLNDQLASNYDPSSLRNDADKQSYLKQYGQIRDQAIAAENERDPKKKALAISEVRQQLGNLGAYAEGSKKQGAMEKQLAMEFMKNPDHYEDDSVDRYKKGLGLEWNNSDVINNASQVERRVDPNKLKTQYDKLKTDQIKPTQWSNGTKKIYTFDGKKKEVIEQNRGVPIDGDNGAYETFLHQVTADPNWKKGLRDIYPEINTGNPTQDLALRARKYMHDQGDEQGWFDKPKEISMEGEAPQRWSLEAQEYHRRTGQWPYTGMNSNPDNPAAVPQGHELTPYGGKGGGHFDAKNVVNLSLPNKNFAGTPAIDLDNGKVVKSLSPSDDYSIVAVKDVPVYKKGTKMEGQIVQPGTESKHPDMVEHKRMIQVQQKVGEGEVKHYLIDYDKMPVNVAGQKDVKASLAKLNQTPVYGKEGDYQHQQTAKDPKTGKTYTLGYKNGKWYDTKTNKEWGQ